MEVIAFISEARLFSNGGMVDLSHERYLQWQQHKAQGTQKHLMPQKPFFPLAWNRNNNTAKTCGSVIWCCCHCFLYTCAGVNCTPPPPCYGWEESIAKPQLSLYSTRMSCQSLTCVVMHFCQYSDSVGIFLPPKSFKERSAHLCTLLSHSTSRTH